MKAVSVQWGIELLQSIGLFLLHPMFWFFIIISLACGYLRIKRERHTFHTKIADMYDELIFTYIKGLIPGILLSILFFGLGISIPFGLLGIIAAVTALLSLTFRMNWLSSAYIVSAGMFIAFILQYTHTVPFADRFPQAFGVNWASAAVFMGLLIITEGAAACRSAHLKTSPALVVFTVPRCSFHLNWIPAIAGIGQRVQGSLPEVSIRITAKRVMILGVIVTAFGAAALWWTPLAGAAACIAVLGRLFLSLRQRLNDNAAPFYFSKRDQGLMVLGIIPNTPADDLELKIGEIITKVNGIPVKHVSDFYEALQKNRAFVKMEIIGLNGEIRFDQRASYEGEHHELGILFVQDEHEHEEMTAL